MSTDTIAKRPGAARFVLPLAVFLLLLIRYKRIGPLTPQIVQEKIVPLVAKLSRE